MGKNNEEAIIVDERYQVKLSYQEKIACLEEIISRLKKILYVYEKSIEPNSTYNYRVYCGGVLLYVSSSNMLFNGELVNIVVNLNTILTNDFEKKQIKKLVLESVNFAQYMLSHYKDNIETRGDGIGSN